jgi:hypothetical protein
MIQVAQALLPVPVLRSLPCRWPLDVADKTAQARVPVLPKRAVSSTIQAAKIKQWKAKPAARVQVLPAWRSQL